MTVFQYSSRHSSGVPVYGVEEAADADALRASLAARGLQLESAASLDLHASVTNRQGSLSRLLQLRIGERLREALLSDLPAHVAVKAVAEEPIEHPILMVHSWSLVIFWFLTVTLGFAALLHPSLGAVFPAVVALSAVLTLMRLPLHAVLVAGPRRLLLDVARRLESGDAAVEALRDLLPTEMKHLAEGKMSEAVRARSFVDLLSGTTQSSLQRMRVASQSTGPLLLGGFALAGAAMYFGYVVHIAGEIVVGSGVTVPWITGLFIWIGNWTHRPANVIALTICMVIYFVLLLVLWLAIMSGRTPAFLLRIPFLGSSLKWLSQGRFCQLLSVPLRNRAGAADALRIAAAGCGLKPLADAGAGLADAIDEGKSAVGNPAAFEGLPMSLLQAHSGAREDGERGVCAAEVFAGLGLALENAATGHGALFVVISEIVIVCFTTGLVLVSYAALFVPLIRLLSDLSAIQLALPFCGGG
jgi:type II secretory pathway component PulF